MFTNIYANICLSSIFPHLHGHPWSRLLILGIFLSLYLSALMIWYTLTFQVRKRGMRCRSSNPRVIKTIRLRRAGLEPWVHKTNIKVVHLVRDPRAIINSVSKRSVHLQLCSLACLSVRQNWKVCLPGKFGCSYSDSGLLKIFFSKYHVIWQIKLWFDKLRPDRSVWSNLLKNATFQCNRSSKHFKPQCHYH